MKSRRQFSVSRTAVRQPTPRWSWLLWASFLAFAPATEAFGSFNLPLCSPSQRKGEYDIIPTRECKRGLPEEFLTCRSNIYRTEQHLINIPAVSCAIAMLHVTDTFYFFGARVSSKTESSVEPPTPAACSLWNSTLVAINVGTLSRKSDSSFETSNKIKHDYRWPSTHRSVVTNAFLHRFQLLYDPILHRLRSPFMALDHCKVESGACRINDKVVVWHPGSDYDCPDIVHIQRADIHLYYNHPGRPNRIEVPALSVSLHHWRDCPPSVCFHGRAICGMSSIILDMHKCRPSFYKHVKRMVAYPRLPTGSQIPLYLNNLQDHVREAFHKQHAEIQYLRCQLAQYLSLCLRNSAILNPSHTLSVLTGRTRAAVAIGDTITEIRCSTKRVRLRRSLRYRDFYATRPLFASDGPNGSEVIYQLNNDDYLLTDISFVERYRPNRILNFKIRGAFYLFINYSFVRVDTTVQPLSPLLLNVSESNIPVTDYVEQSQVYGVRTSDATNWNAVLSSIASAQLTTARVSAFFDAERNGDESVSAADLDVASSLRNLARNSLIALVSSITSPFWQGTLSVLTVLAYFWGAFLTVYSLKCIMARYSPYLRMRATQLYRYARERNLRPRRPPPPDNRADPDMTSAPAHAEPNPPALYPNLRGD